MKLPRHHALQQCESSFSSRDVELTGSTDTRVPGSSAGTEP